MEYGIAGATRVGDTSGYVFGELTWLTSGATGQGPLFSGFVAGANACPYPSLYLNPRTTYEIALLAALKVDRFQAEVFEVDPAGLKDFDSGTRLGRHQQPCQLCGRRYERAEFWPVSKC